MKIALVVGASGAIGQALVTSLTEYPGYDKIVLLLRQPLALEHAKVVQIVFDFSTENYDFAAYNPQHVFCCVGTTMRKAGSKAAFTAVDYDIPCRMANALHNSAAKKMVMVSSIGADAQSKNFYLRTKGLTEQYLYQKLGGRLRVVRPSLLLAKRVEKRSGEDFAIWFYKNLGWVFRGYLKKYRAIKVEDVAKAMIVIANTENPQQIYESYQLQRLIGNNN
jgi:uncharacterized protein YbjT (DUF2867 family)